MGTFLGIISSGLAGDQYYDFIKMGGVAISQSRDTIPIRHASYGRLGNRSREERSRTGKGRKERMKHKIEVLMSEKKESEKKTEQLTRRNMALKRSVLTTW